ncbi:uncharacterized protein LOC135925648 isoform X2 [Gordionus sp. m RMFG-2023]|uniref:uncharacterized protein LOC135925648 isoform X2 n=1 Tax=Gordionus sp. m RMFG-2023 TaxID=3053472 RepID=UPI0031FD5FED
MNKFFYYMSVLILVIECIRAYNTLICKRTDPMIYAVCRKNNEFLTTRREAPSAAYLHEYLHNMDYYIESSDLWIAIKMELQNESLSLNLVQENTPTLIIQRCDFNTDLNEYCYVNGILIISIGSTEIFHGPVSSFIYIRNYNIDFKPYLLEHNGINLNINSTCI